MYTHIVLKNIFSYKFSVKAKDLI